MLVKVKKWGNSASIRIPAEVMEKAQLSIDTAVDIREEDGRVIIEPDNLHEAIDFGDPVSKEAL